MHLTTLVDMIESGYGDRVLLGGVDQRVTGADLCALARRGATTLRGRYDSIVYVGENHPLLPVALLSAAVAGVPFVPVNYRLEDQQLNSLIARQPGALIVADERSAPRIDSDAVVEFEDWIREILGGEVEAGEDLDDNDVAVVLFTSGTTAEPKAALLRHRHLMAYLFGSVQFGSAESSDAALVAVPPYHVAGVANMLSNLFAGRRLVYLNMFDATAWLDTVRSESVTNAMVVPTMLSRIVDALGGGRPDLPSLRSMSYGGAKVSEHVLRRALELLPSVDFVNAYGLTETASTIAVLGPDDHRRAMDSDDPVVQRRLASAGQVLPNVEVEIRDDDDRVLKRGMSGLIFLRGEQISGEYSSGSLLDSEGWFCTRDRGWIDDEGYLFIEGRDDDTIIRGGENIAPAEIEEVLLAHPDVGNACVFGLPDEEWGQKIVAAVVRHPGSETDASTLRTFVRDRLRGSKTPDRIEFLDALPYTETGKLLRRVVRQEIEENHSE